MEDRHKIVDDLGALSGREIEGEEKYSFFGVYDGHGGDVCSSFVTEHLHNDISEQEDFPKDISAAITKGIIQTDKKFAQEHPKLLDDGSTCVCAVIKRTDTKADTIWVGNSGDSRAILIKLQDQEFTAKPLSDDHKPGNPEEKARVEANGGIVRKGVVSILSIILFHKLFTINLINKTVFWNSRT